MNIKPILKKNCDCDGMIIITREITETVNVYGYIFSDISNEITEATCEDCGMAVEELEG